MEESHSSLCCMGCGYFGSAAMEGMCSQCFREHQRRKAQQSDSQSSRRSRTNDHHSNTIPSSSSSSSLNNPVAMETSEVQATPLSDLPASSAEPSPLATTSDPTPKTPKKNRCFLCRKKIGLTGFICRCGNQYCGLHRYADKHGCSFDYKTAGRQELEQRNPRIVADKIQRL